MADSGSNSPMKPEQLDRFMDLQNDELEVRKEEIGLKKSAQDLQKQQDQNSFEYAQKSLDAQLEDRHAQRTYKIKLLNHVLRYALAALIALGILIATLSVTGNEKLAFEILKATAFLASGFGGGYGVGRYRKNIAETELD